MKNYQRFRIVQVFFCLIFFFVGINSAAQEPPNDDSKAVVADNQGDVTSRKIGPLLREILEETKSGYPYSTGKGVVPDQESPEGELIKVIVVMDRNHLENLSEDLINELKEKVERLGGYIGNHAYNKVQIWIPKIRIDELVNWTEIQQIRQPLKPIINKINSEGTSIVGATSWQNSGLRGTGVKIGILDIGFSGYDSLLGEELPFSVNTRIIGSEYGFSSKK